MGRALDYNIECSCPGVIVSGYDEGIHDERVNVVVGVVFEVDLCGELFDAAYEHLTMNVSWTILGTIEVVPTSIF